MTAEDSWVQAERAAAQRLGGSASFDPSAAAALAQLHRAAGAVRQRVEQEVLRRHNLTWTGFVVMRMVWIWTRVETRHAAAQLGIAKGTLTGVVDSLVARDLIRRLGHPTDRRLVLLELTPAGRRMMRRVLKAAYTEESLALAALNAGELEQLTTYLREIAEHVDVEQARSRR